MAEYLSQSTERTTIAARNVVALAVIALVAASAVAQALPDPTRPPASLAPAAEPGADAPSSMAPTLQSVIVAPNRKIAVINGQAVKLGEKYGDARVVKIAETEVVLKNGSELQTLKLFPSIEKKVAGHAAGKHESGR
jgi:MSHA biogenesis protein MshK